MKKLSMLLLFGIITFLIGCGNEISPSSRNSSNSLDSLFDAIFLASEGYEDFAKTISVKDGKPVRVIKDMVGDKDLIYGGPESASDIWTTPPQFHDDDAGGYITLPNVKDILWGSQKFEKRPQPFDVYVVLRDLEAVNYEGYFAVGFGLRNRGDFLAINTSEEGNLDKPVLIEFNKITIVRIRFDGNNSKLWLNNKLVAPGSVNAGKGGIDQLGYGTNSHAAHHDFYGMWVKFGTLTDADHKFIYETLATQYNPGVYPDKPLANHIRAEWNGTGWTATYEYISSTGKAEDTNRTEYQWCYWDPKIDLSNAHFLPGAKAKKKSLVRSDFLTELPGPHNEQGRAVFVMVKVYDEDGNSWKYLRSPFMADNIP